MRTRTRVSSLKTQNKKKIQCKLNMMEISKTLQKEILSVQNKLKNAIRDHQICVGKLKDDPKNEDILRQIQEIQVHIVSLGRCQKQVVSRLRKEVETFTADSANREVKVSVAALLGLSTNNNNNNNHNNNNNNHITPDNGDCGELSTDHPASRRSSKEDYEDDVQSHRHHARLRPKSVETVSDSSDKPDDKSAAQGITSVPNQANFLSVLGLITNAQFTELQKKRVERKRRSTANSQFDYSNWEVITKRKRHCYLQSGNAPQTRQTTARLNGPSPPPKAPKAIPPPVKPKIVPVQKSAARPNILRNLQDKVKQESTNFIPKSKTMHIPGLPSGLTIKRIDSDSAVCVYCKNPKNLTSCEDCETNYHPSCRSSADSEVKLCTKCIEKNKNDDITVTAVKKDDELAAATSASRLASEARKDTKVNQAPGGLYKNNAVAPGVFNVAQHQPIFSSSYLIPFGDQSITTGAQALSQQSHVFNPASPYVSSANGVAYPSLVIGQQFPVQSDIIPFARSETQLAYNYPLPIVHAQESSQQSYLIVKNISDPCVGGIVSYNPHSTSLRNYDLSSFMQKPTKPATFSHDLTSSDTDESTARFSKKSSTRTIPALKPIADKSTVVSGDQKPIVEAAQTTEERRQRRKSDVSRVRSVQSSDVQFLWPRELENTAKGPKSKSFNSQILHPVLSGHHQTNHIADGVDQPRDQRSRAESITDRLLQRLTQDQSRLSRQGQPSTAGKYVKLEEAHLSAPSSADLKQDSSREKANMRPKSCPSVTDSWSLNKDRGTLPRILMRHGRRSVDSITIGDKKINGEWELLSEGIARRKRNQKKEELVSHQTDFVGLEAGLLEDTLSAPEYDDDNEETDSMEEDEETVPAIDMKVLEEFEALMEVNGETASVRSQSERNLKVEKELSGRV